MSKAPNVVNFLEGFRELRQRMGNPHRGINGYASLDDFVLQHGRPWTPQPLPKEHPRGVIKECFRNSAVLVMRHPRQLIYCEGYAMGLIPVMHAWAIDNEGKVIDPTWRTTGKEYFGIAFQFKYLCSALRKQKVYGLIDLGTFRWPLLTLDPKTWKHPIHNERHN